MVTVSYDYSEIYNIKFNFTKDKYVDICENIITYDTETANGIRLVDGTVIGFDHAKYANNCTYKDLIDTGTPVSCVYLWQCAIENEDDICVFLGRSLDDYINFISILSDEINRQRIFGFTSQDRAVETITANRYKKYSKFFIYVHNFGFDFQALRNIFNDDFASHRGKRSATFARTARKPIKSVITVKKCKVEFRDSLVLTQKSLKKWGEDSKLPVKKLSVSDDFYLEIRTPKTLLKDFEIDYGVNDVVTMIYGLQQYRQQYGSIKNIVLTQTGAIRRKCITEVAEKNQVWSEKCWKITKSYSYDFFIKLCKLFKGGWTHANAHYTKQLLSNLKCFDFASSYPAVMTTRTYPIDEFIECDKMEFDVLASQNVHSANYRWFAKIKLTNVITSKQNTFWSISKCENSAGVISDNGRIYQAEEMEIFIEDLDWDTFKQAYTYDTIDVIELYKSKAGYLPKELIELILTYFSYKTSLKGDATAESKYIESKQFINSIYGCAVTKIVTDLVDFMIDGWGGEKLSGETGLDIFEKSISEATSDKKQHQTFLTYQIGIWVTAWARHNLWDFILQFDDKIVYCDTDSIKGFFDDTDLQWIDRYNDKIAQLEDYVASVVGFDKALYTPKTNTGKIKRLGIMEREEDAVEFVTLGAKRYCYKTEDNEIHITVAGLPKEAGSAKIAQVRDFLKPLVWDTSESKKLIAYYNDNQPACKWIDRDGNEYFTDEKYGVCLLPTTFDLSLTNEYEKFLEMIESGEIEDLTDVSIVLR